jgi:hypothetical protein
MHPDPREPNAGHVQPNSGSAVEDHGRAVTAIGHAATFYRQAQKPAEVSNIVMALRHATTTDPNFALAVADLDALTGAPPGVSAGRQTNWERHHIEVVRTAAVGNHSRAADMLREHIASVGCDPVGCDPLALRIVTELRWRAGHRDGLDDLRSRLPRCHPASMFLFGAPATYVEVRL